MNLFRAALLCKVIGLGLLGLPGWLCAKEAIDWQQFDLLKQLNEVEHVDLVVLKGWAMPDHVGQLVEKHSLTVGPVVCEVDRVIASFQHWDSKAFRKLFKGYDRKVTYEHCLCSPLYAMALIFYVDGEPLFGFDEWDKEKKMERKKVGIILFDECHDSVVVTDILNGMRVFRFSVGHSEDARVPQLIKQTLKAADVPYEFMKY